MKKFLQIDFYVQTLTVILSVVILGILTSYHQYPGVLFYYYYIVGGVQLISFLVRMCLSYKKSLFFIIYGLLILPIWTSLLASLLEIEILNFLFVFTFLGLFYAPFMSIFYIVYCYETYKIHSKSSY